MNSSNCTFCPRQCGVNRLEGELGYCKTSAGYLISSICDHHGEEPVISGRHGICNIFFTNCNLQCIYCQNYQISRNRDRSENDMDADELISQITYYLDKGCHAVGFVSASHVVPQIKSIIQELNNLGYKPITVYNSNGYDSVDTLRTLEGIIDVYLPDFKYSDPMLAREYSNAEDYPEIALMALKEMYRQKGSALHLNENDEAISGILIRHLVLPGHVENSKTALKWIAEEVSPKLHISLMSQYYPTSCVTGHPVLGRTLKRSEYEEVVRYMDELGMNNGWIQELESQGHYRPDFRKEHPFNDLTPQPPLL